MDTDVFIGHAPGSTVIDSLHMYTKVKFWPHCLLPLKLPIYSVVYKNRQMSYFVYSTGLIKTAFIDICSVQ